MFILLYYFGCKITKKSANRTYAIYGFIYPFYGFSFRRFRRDGRYRRDL